MTPTQCALATVPMAHPGSNECHNRTLSDPGDCASHQNGRARGTSVHHGWLTLRKDRWPGGSWRGHIGPADSSRLRPPRSRRYSRLSAPAAAPVQTPVAGFQGMKILFWHALLFQPGLAVSMSTLAQMKRSEIGNNRSPLTSTPSHPGSSSLPREYPLLFSQSIHLAYVLP